MAVTAVLLPSALAQAAPPSSSAVPLLSGVTCASLAPGSGGQVTIPASSIGLPTLGATIDSATLVPAGTVNGVSRPEYCDVRGTILSVDPQAEDIKFAAAVPTAWNEKAWQFGGSGLNGFVPDVIGASYGSPSSVPPLSTGYAVYGGDSGHAGQTPGPWITNDESWLNYAHQGIKKTHDASIWILKKLYGRGPTANYYIGTSGGGREGLIAANRYPGDYQGIAANMPAVDLSNIFYDPAYKGKIQLNPANYLPPTKANAVATYVLSKCDALDGRTDGVINNYLDCSYRLDVTRTAQPFQGLLCSGAETDNCLTAAQITTLESFYKPVQYPYALAGGRTTFAGYPGGMENLPPLGPFGPQTPWLFSPTAPAAHDPAYFGGGGGVLGGPVTQMWLAKRMGNPNFSLLDLDLTTHKTHLQLYSEQLDIATDIRTYLRAGGKIVIVTNGSDAVANSRAQMEYYNRLLTNLVNGGPAAVKASVKYYVLPNQGHSYGGVDAQGNLIPDNVDVQSLIQNWVENNVVPGAAPVATTRAGTATKPVCIFPSYPRYKGSGDPAAASSYVCTKALYAPIVAPLA
ncbi:Tannase and feruloyl esterase [Parafrankia sp. EAN1pec]|uniref:tannase/feruloyl esterase family alpha/beta hydrolase n=1 Tax=Parafrankia sp. (strain EAN1pec) TaxID=298653 RepID=UPI0000540F85|nr:Tannase and feruloyl esterase [Frankia sp. EAN1pec]